VTGTAASCQITQRDAAGYSAAPLSSRHPVATADQHRPGGTSGNLVSSPMPGVRAGNDRHHNVPAVRLGEELDLGERSLRFTGAEFQPLGFRDHTETCRVPQPRRDGPTRRSATAVFRRRALLDKNQMRRPAVVVKKQLHGSAYRSQRQTAPGIGEGWNAAGCHGHCACQ
jgi:hypothetical protein